MLRVIGQINRISTFGRLFQIKINIIFITFGIDQATDQGFVGA